MAALALSLLAAGCGDDADDESGGPAPVVVSKRDAGPRTGGSGGSDAGIDDGDDGGVGIGQPVPGECRANDPVVPPDGPSAAPEGTGVSLPNDMDAERVLVTWEGTCEEPVLRIELSEGRCPSGTGHAVVLRLDANRIVDGSIAAGLTILEPESAGQGISLRYLRSRRDPPAGEWGNCKAPTSDGGVVDGGPTSIGSINFYGEPSLEAGAELVARLNMVGMPDCTVAGRNGPADLTAAFRVTLQRGLDDVCR